MVSQRPLHTTAQARRASQKRRKIASWKQSLSLLQQHVDEFEITIESHCDLHSSLHTHDKSFVAAKKRADADDKEVNNIIRKCARQLEEKILSYQTNVQDMENCLLKREEWWLSINILSPTLPQRYIDRLSADLPERPEELFNSLDRALLPAANTIPANDSHGLGKVFMTRVIEEMWRLGRMQGGERYALLLFLKFQLEYLHVLKDGTKDYHRRRHESKEINLALADLLAEIRAKPTNIYIRSHYYRQNIPYFNAVAACRRLRKAMETFPCKHRGYHPDDDICIHKNLAAALHLLQKCAYAEVGSNVLRAVGKRLPKEISDHVREFVMLAEQVPMDPRVLVTTGNWGVGESRSAYSCPKLLIKKA